ncbi:MAG TPA: cobalamin-dependent protein, partial [Candidatus Krumholzibacteria bacterium]|nr:cobalamin-dependent protein [Candidatus Krumholzibacteria bacterium]
MKILLVEPRTPDTFWSLRHALRFIGRRAANPPLGLLTLAGLLPRDWSLRLVDQNTDKLADEDIAWADYVMVSAMVIHREEVAKLGKRCRALDTPLIGGGPLFRAESEESLGVDHVVVGETEELAEQL